MKPCHVACLLLLLSVPQVALSTVLSQGDVLVAKNSLELLDLTSGRAEPIADFEPSVIIADSAERIIFPNFEAPFTRLYRYTPSSGGLELLAADLGVIPTVFAFENETTLLTNGSGSGLNGVRRIDLASGTVTDVTSSPLIGQAQALAVDPTTGDILVGSFSGVFRLDASLGLPTQISTTGVGDIAVSPSGTIFVVRPGFETTISLLDETSGALLPVSTFVQVLEIETDASGNLFALAINGGPGANARTVFDVNPTDGSFSAISVLPTGYTISSLTTGPTNFFLRSFVNANNPDRETVFSVSRSDGSQAGILYAGLSASSVSGVVARLDPSGSVVDLVVTTDQGEVLSVDPTNGFASTLASGGLLSLPRQPILAANGDIVFIDTNSVLRLTQPGGSIQILASGGLADTPVAIAEEGIGTFLIANGGTSPGLYRLELNLTHTPLRLGDGSLFGPDPFNRLSDVVLDSNGNAILSATRNAFAVGSVVSFDPGSAAEVTLVVDGEPLGFVTNLAAGVSETLVVSNRPSGFGSLASIDTTLGGTTNLASEGVLNFASDVHVVPEPGIGASLALGVVVSFTLAGRARPRELGFARL